MRTYVIKSYHPRYDLDHVRIGNEVAKGWVWPFAHDLLALQNTHNQPDFDPDLHLYAFVDGEMVGFIFGTIHRQTESSIIQAYLNFPRVLNSYEDAEELLMSRALYTLRDKGVSLVTSHVSTMCPNTINVAEKYGFTIKDWGYKVYYDYEMHWGNIRVPHVSVEEMDPGSDLADCSQLAARWYHKSPAWCLEHLSLWHQQGIITHSGIRSDNDWIASCMVAPNEIRPSTAAMYYIYSPDELTLRQLLAYVVQKCIRAGITNLIADLVNEHRPYEPIYQKLGFQKVVEWALCELEM